MRALKHQPQLRVQSQPGARFVRGGVHRMTVVVDEALGLHRVGRACRLKLSPAGVEQVELKIGLEREQALVDCRE